MQINKTNNVIFLKDVESNVIQEAFVVLKENDKNIAEILAIQNMECYAENYRTSVKRGRNP